MAGLPCPQALQAQVVGSGSSQPGESPFAKMWVPIFVEMDSRDTLLLRESPQGSSLGWSQVGQLNPAGVGLESGGCML